MIGAVAVFWLFNYGPLQLTSTQVQECGLWAHNLYNEFLPDYDYAFRRIASGEMPLWNPFQGGGIPSLAALQAGVFYPPNVLFLAISPESAISYSALFHFSLAALFMYLFFLNVFSGDGSIGASIAVLAFVFNPRMYEFVLFPGNFMSACWLPAVMYFGERLVAERTLKRCALLAMSAGMPFLAGFPQVAVYIYQTLILFFLYKVGRLAFVGRKPREAITILALGALAALVAILIIGPQVVPTFELTRHSARSLGTMTAEMSQVYGADACSFSTWLAGVLSYPKEIALVDGRHPIPPWGVFLVLAGLGLSRKTNLSMSIFLLAIALFFFVLSLGTNTPLYRLYWDYIPTGNWFTTPVRLRLTSYFCVALIAGHGADMLSNKVTTEWQTRLGVVLRAGTVAILSATMVGACLIVIRDSLPRSVVFIGAHFLLLAGLCFASQANKGFLQRLLLTLLIGLIILESFKWYSNRVPFPAMVNPRQNLYSRAAAESLKPLRNGWRAHIENGWGLGFFGLPTVPEKFGSLFEIPVTTNWEPLTLGNYQDYCNQLTGRRWYYGHFQLAGRPFDEKMFDMLAARFIVISDAGKDWISSRIRTEEGRRRYRLIKDLGPQKIYENTEAMDRVNFASRVEIMKNPDELFRRMHDRSFDLRTTALLLEPLSEPLVAGRTNHITQSLTNAVKSFSIDYENVQIEVDSSGPGVVWISDSFYPGWRVFIDGVEGSMIRVNYAFRGVYIAGGNHKITMIFAPPSLRLGFLFGGVGLLLFAFMISGVGKLVECFPGRLNRRITRA